MTQLDGTIKMYMDPAVKPRPMHYVEFIIFEAEYLLVTKGLAKSSGKGPKGEIDAHTALRETITRYAPYMKDYLDIEIPPSDFLSMIKILIQEVLKTHPRNNSTNGMMLMSYNDLPKTTLQDMVQIFAMAREYFASTLGNKFDALLHERAALQLAAD